MDTAAGAQIEQFFRSMASVGGIAGILCVFGLIFLSFLFRPVRWWVVGMLLFASTFPISTEAPTTSRALAYPLDAISEWGKAPIIGLLAVLLCISLFGRRGTRQRLISPAAWAFLAFEVVLACRAWFGGETDRGATSLLIFLIVFLAFNLGPSRWLQGTADLRSFLGAFILAAVLYLLANAYQLIQNPDNAVAHHRFFGTSVNPQFAAANLVAFLLPCIAAALHKGTGYIAKVLLSFLIGFILVLLVWTGSRTGGIMAFVGIVILLRLRWVRTFGIVVVGILAFWLFWQAFGLGSADVEHLVSQGNSRSGIAGELMDSFIKNPAIGVMRDTDSATLKENSYLSVLASTGLFGAIPFAASIALLAYGVFRLQRVRRFAGNNAIMIDLITAGFASILVGSFFEGFLLGLVTTIVFTIYFYFSLLAFLLDNFAQPHDGANAGLIIGEPRFDPELYEAGFHSSKPF